MDETTARGIAPAVEPADDARPRGQTRAVFGWKIVEYTGQVLFVFATPRLMGPDHFGRFAALLSLTSLMIMASALGAQATFARFIPEYQAAGRATRIRALFTQLFLLRGAAALIFGVAFLAFFPKVLEGTSRLTTALGAATLLVGAMGTTTYQLCYGLNDLGRWLTRDALNRPVLLALLFILGGLESPERAALALCLTELSLLALGSFWARSYFLVGRDAFDTRLLFTHLAFGFVFFIANLLVMAVWRGGETAIAVFSGREAEIAYFSVSAALAMTVSALIGQLGNIITPAVTTFHLAGDFEQVDAWLGNSLKYFTILCVGIVLVIWAMGDELVRLLLGPDYRPVVANLRILAFALLAVPFMRTAISLAVVRGEPNRSLVISGSGLAAFVLAAVLLVPPEHSAGASWAVVTGVVASAGVATLQFPMGSILAGARFWRLLGISLLPVAIVVVGFPGLPPKVGNCLALLGYPALLFWGRIVAPDDIRAFMRRF